jgi:cell shape-determining protein MreC
MQLIKTDRTAGIEVEGISNGPSPGIRSSISPTKTNRSIEERE